MRAAGKDIIGLGAGEPDFDTPDHIKAAAVKAMDSGFTKYTAVDGTASLKKAIIAKFKNDNGLDYQPKQVLVSCGGKQSLYNLTQRSNYTRAILGVLSRYGIISRRRTGYYRNYTGAAF